MTSLVRLSIQYGFTHFYTKASPQLPRSASQPSPSVTDLTKDVTLPKKQNPHTTDPVNPEQLTLTPDIQMEDVLLTKKREGSELVDDSPLKSIKSRARSRSRSRERRKD